MALFSQAEFKEYSSIPAGVTAHDALITSLSTMISAAVDKYLRRTVEAATITETHSGTGKDRIRVLSPPIRTLTTVHSSQNQTWDASTLVAANLLLTDEGAGVIYRKPQLNPELWPLDKPIFPQGTLNIRIVYDGGFAAVPEDLKLAAMMWARAVFDRRRAMGVVSRSVAGASESFEQATVPKMIRPFLDQYRMPYRARAASVS